MARISKGKIRN